jgi:hypothetical protein
MRLDAETLALLDGDVATGQVNYRVSACISREPACVSHPGLA